MFRFNYPSPNSDHAPFVYRLGVPVMWLRYTDHVWPTTTFTFWFQSYGECTVCTVHIAVFL